MTHSHLQENKLKIKYRTSQSSNTGTVHCPKLMRVESYQTVHQLVSTVSGQVLDRTTSGSYLKAAFPPGSMTGAPKVTSCELLERLEEVERGVYGGALGFISVHDACDLSVVIRTYSNSSLTETQRTHMTSQQVRLCVAVALMTTMMRSCIRLR